MQKTIKSISQANCPNCGKEIFVCHQQTPAVVSWVLKKEDIEMAKKEVSDRISDMELPEKTLKNVMEWLDDPNTVFGPDDIESVVKGIKSTL